MEQTGLASYEQIQSWNYNSSLPAGVCQEYLHFEINFQDPKVDCLYEAIDDLFGQEPSLRTTLYRKDRLIIQRIAEGSRNYAQRLVHLDMTGQPDQQATIRDLSHQYGLRIRLDDRDCYCRYLFIRMAASKWKFCFFIHHIICDAWSINLIKEKLLQLYDDRLFGRQAIYPTSAFNLIDYAGWQRNVMEPKKRKLSHFWKQKLAEPLSDDQTDFASNFAKTIFHDCLPVPWRMNEEGFLNILKTSTAKVYLWEFGPQETDQLRSICQRYRISLLSVFYCVFKLIPWLHDQEKPTLLASPVSYRFTPQTKNLIGHLIGGMYSYTRIDPSWRLTEFLQRTYMELLKAIHCIIYDHDVLDIKLLPIRLHCDIFLNMISKDFQLEPDKRRLGIHECRPAGCYYALHCGIIETEKSIYLDWEYKDQLYEAWQIEYLSRSVKNLIAPLHDKDDQSLAQLYDTFKALELT